MIFVSNPEGNVRNNSVVLLRRRAVGTAKLQIVVTVFHKHHRITATSHPNGSRGNTSVHNEHNV